MAKNSKTDPSVLAYRTIIGAIIVLAVGGFAVVYWSNRPVNTVPVDDTKMAKLAECLTQAGAKMYGTYWCPHCQKQKKEFGGAIEKVNYVECADQANPRVQMQACTDAGVTGYPTWIFADGSRLEGEQTFKQLADKAGCPWTE
jgi:hypothetical protein